MKRTYWAITLKTALGALCFIALYEAAGARGMFAGVEKLTQPSSGSPAGSWPSRSPSMDCAGRRHACFIAVTFLNNLRVRAWRRPRVQVQDPSSTRVAASPCIR